MRQNQTTTSAARAAGQKTVQFDSLPVGSVFYINGSRLTALRKTAKDVTFGCFRRGRFTFRKSAMYRRSQFIGATVEL